MDAMPPLEMQDLQKPPGSWQWLIQETYNIAKDLSRVIWKGNGEKSLMTRMDIIEDSHEHVRKDVDEIQKAMKTVCDSMLIAQHTIAIYSKFMVILGVPILLALLVGVGTLIWAIITHQPIFYVSP